jgi:hypothetical protein
MKPRAKTIIERHGFLDRDREKPTHDEIQIWAYRNICAILREVFPEHKIPEQVPLAFEYAIMDKNYVVGFVDLFSPNFNFGIEVKTEIPSIGDLLRQIHFYKQYQCTAAWIVISPDDRYAHLLKDQGIKFFKYKSPGELF